MKKCKSCQAEIDEKAKKCPHCQSDQRSWFGRHPILTVIGGFILFGVIVSSSNSSGDKPTTTTGEEKQSVKQRVEPSVTVEPTFTKPIASPTGKPITAKPTIKPVEKKTSGVSMEQFNRIHEGMSYEEAVAILGSSGELLSSNEISGYKTVMYMWEGNSFASNMNAMFQNGKMISKAQFGLK